MSEGVKTLIFVGVGLVVAAAAVASRPRFQEVRLEEKIGEPLFAEFDDPSKAARMTLAKYDADMGELRSFEVARDRQSGAWTIPSHAGYPADAEERMRDAALMLVDLRVLGIASQIAGDHAMYGVLEPDRERLRLGDDGVGLMLSFENNRGQSLASLVIGRQVRGADDQRFVRIPGQDVVYAVSVDPDRLSTRFTDWIERDLLQLTSWDIEDVTIKNYSVERAMDRASLNRQFDFTARFEDNQWQLVELTRYGSSPTTVSELPANQELDGEKLNALKTAVDNLRIANVFRKPRGLGADLKAGTDFLQDEASKDDLWARGFYPGDAGGDTLELFAAHGEVHVGMNDGVQYVLRFGETVAGSSDELSEGQNRYLFVTARVDMDKFPQPELASLPELPSREGQGGEPDAEAEDADQADDADADPADDDLEAEEAQILQERERINRENQRKLDDWNERLSTAREQVAELNVRFGDWYYVVDEQQYSRIRLSLDQLIRDKDSDDQADDALGADVEIEADVQIEGDGIDAFRQLQESGLQ